MLALHPRRRPAVDLSSQQQIAVRRRGTRRAAVPRLVAFAASAVVCVVALNLVIAARGLPSYGSWTGIRSLEAKLRLLERRVALHPLDALVLGSSIADFGFNAEHYSALLSAKLGRDYTAFNFGSGATEFVTMPKLYRLARMVARPKQLLLVVPGEIKRPDTIGSRSPDYILERAPVGAALKNPPLLPLSKWLFQQPLLRDSAALRDIVTTGRFDHLDLVGSDFYYLSDYGDSVSFSYQASATDLEQLRQGHIEMLQPLSENDVGTLALDKRLEHYFGPSDIAGMRELRELATRDGVEIVVVAHSAAATFFPDPVSDPTYVLTHRQFFTTLAEALGAILVYDLENFSVPRYALTDSVHLNQFGARMFAGRAAAQLLDTPDLGAASGLPRELKAPRLAELNADDPTYDEFGALVITEPRSRTLRLRYVVNHAFGPLTSEGWMVAALTPDGDDVRAPARVLSDDTLDVTFPRSARDQQILLVRLLQYDRVRGMLVARTRPVADYQWLD